MSDRSRTRVTEFAHGLGCGTRATRAVGGAGRVGGHGSPLGPLLTRGLTGYAHRNMAFGAWLEPPRPELTLQIALDGAITADGEPLPRAWLGGLAHRHTVVGVGRTYAGVDLKLDPLHARALVGMPLSELTGECVALEDLFGAPAARELVGRVAQARDWDARFDAVERFLAGRLGRIEHARRATSYPDPTVGRAWQRLIATSGRVRIDALAAELGCSRRHLARRFADDIGLPPKAVARQLRLQALRRAVEHGTGPIGWARLAAEHGYADQAHLIRDVRDLTGVTPAQLLARRIPEGGLVGDGV